MNKPFITDRTFKGQDFRKKPLQKAEYENCIFDGCDFSEGYLDHQNFMECEFMDCNLSNANITQTIFNDVSFSHCKMIGLKFEDCNTLFMAFGFNHCILNYSSFYRLKLKNIIFMDSKLIAVDFTETDLTAATFDACELDKAVFYDTILEKTDFSTAYHFNIDPERNRIKKAVFSKANMVGLLTKYDIVIKD